MASKCCKRNPPCKDCPKRKKAKKKGIAAVDRSATALFQIHWFKPDPLQ